MTDADRDPRAVDAMAEAIASVLDSWDADRLPAWAGPQTDSRAVAEAIIDLLSQYGYRVTPIQPD